MTDIRCIAGPRYKYAWNRDDTSELYDTWSDPAELRNLARASTHEATLARLQDALLAWMRDTDDPLLATHTQEHAAPAGRGEVAREG